MLWTATLRAVSYSLLAQKATYSVDSSSFCFLFCFSRRRFRHFRADPDKLWSENVMIEHCVENRTSMENKNIMRVYHCCIETLIMHAYGILFISTAQCTHIILMIINMAKMLTINKHCRAQGFPMLSTLDGRGSATNSRRFFFLPFLCRTKDPFVHKFWVLYQHKILPQCLYAFFPLHNRSPDLFLRPFIPGVHLRRLQALVLSGLLS